MWQPSISKRALCTLGILALFATTTTSAQAAAFSVDPISVTLKQANSSTTVAMTNQSPQSMRFQITGFAWAESPSGDMQLAPTGDLVFFPELVELKAGETRRIRVGLTTAPGSVEKTFRVFMEELPSLAAVTQQAGSTLTLRMKIGIPIFLSPAGAPVVSGAVQNAAVHGTTLEFDVANTGNTHFSVQTVHVVGKNASGGDLFAQDLTGWYVLAGTTRHYTVQLTQARCSALRSLVVNVKTDTVSFSHNFEGVSSGCTAA